MRFINFSKRDLRGLRLLLLVIVLSALMPPYVYSKDTCINCHKDDKFRVQNRVIFDYYNRWKDSIHDLAGVTCTDCHSGDPTSDDKQTAHKDNFVPLTKNNGESFKKVPQICGRCHEAVLKNYLESKHYKTLLEQGSGPHCATCHGSVNTEIYYTSIIAKTCEDCHNNETKNLAEISKTADDILHRINVLRAYRNWALFFYAGKDKKNMREINELYGDIADSWHKFNFEQLDEKTINLLNKLKAVVNRGLTEVKKEEDKK